MFASLPPPSPPSLLLLTQLSSELKKVSTPISPDIFNGLSYEVRPRLDEFQGRRAKVNETAEVAFGAGETLICRLEKASQVSSDGLRSPVNYDTALIALRGRLERHGDEKRKVDETCECRENRWSLTIQLNQFEKDVKKVGA